MMTKIEIERALSSKFDLNNYTTFSASEGKDIVLVNLVPNGIERRNWLGGLTGINKISGEILEIGSNPIALAKLEDEQGPFETLDW